MLRKLKRIPHLPRRMASWHTCPARNKKTYKYATAHISKAVPAMHTLSSPLYVAGDDERWMVHHLCNLRLHNANTVACNSRL